MPRITKVYTRGGDDGSTSLGGGQRVRKSSSRVEAYGTVDELNSVIGAARAAGLAETLDELLDTVQNNLFDLGADLCILEEDKKEERRAAGIGRSHVESLEGAIDRMNEKLGPLENFILPGGSQGAAMLHIARTVCRRAERRVVALAEQEAVGAWSIRYLNRLSDALFVMARHENRYRGKEEVYWRGGGLKK
jgi:cob(I)alamin adenosyltransferase